MPDSKEIGKRIEKLLKNKGVSRSEFANDLNISTSSVGMYCIGGRIPRDSVKKLIADYFEVSIESIFFKD